MNNLVKEFENMEFGKIRMIEENGKMLFVGSDVAKSLGYMKPQNAVSTHCKGALKRGIPTNGGIQDMLVIPEGDLYRLIVNSKLPTAEKFELWVFDEVLPSIRKTGSYQKPMTQLEILAETTKALLEQDKRINGVESEVKSIKEGLPLFSVDCNEIQHMVKKIGVNALGGKDSPAYKDASVRGKVYSDIQRQLKREFQVSSYAAIKHSKVDLALKIIGEYRLPFSLAADIEAINNPEGL